MPDTTELKGAGTFNEAARQTALEIANLICSKQLDYGKANILDFGEMGLLVRANDKMARLRNLYRSGADPNNESVEDSWTDLAGYALLALMYMRGGFDLPIVDPRNRK